MHFYDDIIKLLLNEFSKSKINKRYFIALAGAPGSGKSTISRNLCEDLNKNDLKADILQMDGFHFDDAILLKKNLLQEKGSPKTFDVAGLINCIKRLKNEKEVTVPVFDRNLELSRSSAYTINPYIEIIIIEGNYLLINDSPWNEVHPFIDCSILIHTERKVLIERLKKRWESFQLSQNEIDRKVFKNDIPNGEYVISNSIKSDFILSN